MLTIDPPAGFSRPANGAETLAGTVIAAALMTTAVTVGENLQTTTNIRLNAPAPAGGMSITLTSADSGRVLFARTATAVGQPSLVLTVFEGLTRSADFYVQGLANSGAVSYSVTSPGFTPVSGTVNLSKSGFVLTGPFGTGANFSTTTGSQNSPLDVNIMRLDSASNPIESQAIRGGLTLDVDLTSAAPAVGAIVGGPAHFTGGATTVSVEFDPATPGTALLAITTPPSFTSPSTGASLTATVRVPGLAIEDNLTIGNNLQAPGSILLGQVAPAGGIAVTLSTSSPNVVFSATETGVGSSTLIVTVPAGQAAARYYLQAKASSGSATYSGSAPGFTVRTATVNFAPSGIIINGPSGLGYPFSISAAGGPRIATISVGLLDSVTSAFLMPQSLAGGLSLVLPLTNSNPAAATVPSQVTLTGGVQSLDVTVTPVSPGSTQISLPVPAAGFTTPRSGTSLPVTVH